MQLKFLNIVRFLQSNTREITRLVFSVLIFFVLLIAFVSPNALAIQDTAVSNPDQIAQKCVNAYGLDNRVNASGNTNGLVISDLFRPARFLPIVPQTDCAASPDGSPQPLPIGVLSIVLVRLFGFIAGLIFYFVFAVIVVSGIMFIWDGIDGQQAAQAKKNLSDSVYALILVIGTYVIINTILIVLGVNSEVKNGDLGAFFGLPGKN